MQARVTALLVSAAAAVSMAMVSSRAVARVEMLDEVQFSGNCAKASYLAQGKSTKFFQSIGTLPPKKGQKPIKLFELKLAAYDTATVLIEVLLSNQSPIPNREHAGIDTICFSNTDVVPKPGKYPGDIDFQSVLNADLAIEFTLLGPKEAGGFKHTDWVHGGTDGRRAMLMADGHEDLGNIPPEQRPPVKDKDWPACLGGFEQKMVAYGVAGRRPYVSSALCTRQRYGEVQVFYYALNLVETVPGKGMTAVFPYTIDPQIINRPH